MKAIALLIFLFGIATWDSISQPWAIASLLLFALPLVAQFIRYRGIQVWTLCAGIVLVVQAVLSPVFYMLEYKIWESNFTTYTNQPNMHAILDVRGGIPGIQGRQLITTDAKGFRKTLEVDYGSDATFRIFAIGGSTTDQLFLDDRATWTHLLQERLAATTDMDIEVVNAGVTGLRLQQHVWTLRNILDLHPDLVLFLIGINDWNRQIMEAFPSENRIRPVSLRARVIAFRNNMALRNTLLGNLFAAVSERWQEHEPLIIVESGDTYAKERGSLNRSRVFSFYPENVSPEYVRNLYEVSSICRSNNIMCVFITQPTGYHADASAEFRASLWMTPPYEDYTLDFDSMVSIAALYNDFLIHFARENGHHYCDAASALSPSFENFYDDCHFNTQGAQNMSGVVGRCLEDVLQTGSSGAVSDGAAGFPLYNVGTKKN